VRALLAVVAVLAVAAGAFWWLSAPRPLTAAVLPANHVPDAANGETVFWAAGCASCHAAPGAEGEDRLVLAGGLALETPFGPVTVPNISPDPEHGIGGWSGEAFADAVLSGLSPDGQHYLPAFPYSSYRLMRPEDVADLKAFMDTLPPSANAAEATGLAFPFGWRRPIGLWKRVALADPPPSPSEDPATLRGHYLVTALGHCGECHTPRTALYGLDMERWLAGAVDPGDGEGRVPDITPGPDGIAGWSAGDVAYLLESGFTPDFDSVGGSMASVTRNFANVPASDRQAIGAYLTALPPAGTPRM
jgi:mono/diheme cytochrome c family protein